MRIRQVVYDWLAYPHRIAAIKRFVVKEKPRLLDVGRGNHSPKITKRYLPMCEYHGIEHTRWNLDAEDDEKTDRVFRINLEDPDALDAVPDQEYDVVICSHVLEHLSDPYAVVAKLAHKLKPGAVLYVEVPSETSLRLPKTGNGWMGVRGCLNFCDDETHKTMVDLHRISEVLKKSGFTVSRTRRRLLWRRIVLLPFYVGGVLLFKGFVPASVLWDITGFAKFLVATREREPSVGR